MNVIKKVIIKKTKLFPEDHVMQLMMDGVKVHLTPAGRAQLVKHQGGFPLWMK